MELKEAASEARRLLELHGFGYANIVFYDLVQPSGLQLRNTIGLSIPYTLTNDGNSIVETLIHEIGHLLTRDEQETHGPFWEMETRRIDGFHQRTLSPKWKAISAAYDGDWELQEASKRYLSKIADEIHQRADCGLQKDTDFTSFANPPRIEPREFY